MVNWAAGTDRSVCICGYIKSNYYKLIANFYRRVRRAFRRDFWRASSIASELKEIAPQLERELR